MKNFRRSLATLLAQQYQLKLLQAVVLVQRNERMKQFRRHLNHLIQHRRHQEHLALQNHSALIIQKYWKLWKFRVAMSRYRQAAVRIQRWIRFDMADRFTFLRHRRAAMTIQQLYKKRFAQRVDAAILIQKNWRMWREMKAYSYHMLQIIRIQRWVRSKADRFR